MYEGFGLPPLEAMACGTPVIASRVASLPEVLAEAAILVEAGDISGLSRAISEIITDNPLREGLSRKGIDRNSLFSWQDTTKKTLAIYKQVINNKYNFEEREKV
jgi:glycosyltransferase involved in cell wall biosynthesis